MWSQIITFNIPWRKHLIKYPLVKQIKVALCLFQEQEAVKLTNWYLYPVGYHLLSGGFLISLNLLLQLWQPSNNLFKGLAPKACKFYFPFSYFSTDYTVDLCY